MNPHMDTITTALLIIIVTIFSTGLLATLILKINDFSHELDYLNREIGRTEGEERQYWKREKQRLWLSLLPFFADKKGTSEE